MLCSFTEVAKGVSTIPLIVFIISVLLLILSFLIMIPVVLIRIKTKCRSPPTMTTYHESHIYEQIAIHAPSASSNKALDLSKNIAYEHVTI